MENITTKYIIAAGFLVMVAFTGCTEKKQNEEAGSQNYCISKELKKDLKLVDVERLPVEESITLTGEVESNSDKTVPFVSLVDGVVTETYFSLGNYVKKDRFWPL